MPNDFPVSISGFNSMSLHTPNHFCIWSPLIQNNTLGKEWRLQTFLTCFSGGQTQQQIERLISESKCPETGHPKKARKLIQKWLRYKRRSGVKLDPKVEQVLWRTGKGSRRQLQSEEAEEVEEIESPEVLPPYVTETMKDTRFTMDIGESQITIPPIDFKLSTVDVDSFKFGTTNSFKFGIASCNNFEFSTVHFETTFQEPKKRCLSLGEIISGDPTELKRRRIGSPASQILTRQFEMQRLDEAIQELEKERKAKQQLVDRYNAISVFREHMLDEFPTSIGVNQFIADIRADSMLYLNNYRQDLDVFIYLYGIDSARVPSLLDHTVQIFNAYATNLDKRSQITATFNRIVQYLVVNNFSRQCQQPQREFDNLQESFFEGLSCLS